MRPRAISIFPDPIGSRFRLFTPDGAKAKVLGLQDHEGTDMIYKYSKAENELDLSDLPPGIYKLRMEVHGSEMVKRLVKLQN